MNSFIEFDFRRSNQIRLILQCELLDSYSRVNLGVECSGFGDDVAYIPEFSLTSLPDLSFGI